MVLVYLEGYGYEYFRFILLPLKTELQLALLPWLVFTFRPLFMPGDHTPATYRTAETGIVLKSVQNS